LECKVGMLIFDEMKIKGLVWSAESNKLLVFTDIEYEGKWRSNSHEYSSGFF